ncbi:hypothetical protein A1O3_10206 [Capronia epimyces CBS 606.96]|uniref:DUF7924 domain-containing protein n=1 Tax=Capronia epimyces CBS 606.96 TaxID=1182542 RepID=W9XA07_9EURO|nr:uncharacterized protein A1O3_10206 [Capronia epimyces CBS 606.96]EXJ77048.1 hypothetical protein A1O3_10206 [Capronia epimyces CBS 606.96]
MPAEILCPQPRRPLKRKFIDNDNDNDGWPSIKSKRTLLDFFPDFSAPSDSEPLLRCRSDSFLLQTMSPRLNPPRKCRAPPRHQDELPAHLHSIPTDVNNPSQLCTSPATPPSTYIGESPPDLLLEGSSPLASREATPTDSRRSSPRVRDPCYRSTLRRNNIEIGPVKVPLSIREYGRQIIERPRDSPTLPEFQVESMVSTLRLLRDADEGIINNGCTILQLFPNTFLDYQGKVNAGSNIPLSLSTLPRVSLVPPPSNPRPDYHYCLDPDSFSAEELEKQALADLQPYAQPSTAGFWPFLVMECKSQSRGGNFYVASSQNAVAGAICVNSMEKLLTTAQTVHTEIDSVCFSCNIDAERAEVHIHYFQNGRFISAELEDFNFKAATDVVHFRNCVRNMVEFGFKDRLPQIQALLAKIPLPPV